MAFNVHFKLGASLNKLKKPCNYRTIINAVPDVLTRPVGVHRCRVATSTDYHDVINMCAPSSGRENLRMLFPECMKDRKLMSHVHYVDREYAGFTAIQLVDNGCTALWRHARLRPRFSEPGMFGDIMRQLLVKMRKSHPEVTSQVFASTDDVSTYIRGIPVFSQDRTREVLNRKIISRRFKSSDLKPLQLHPSSEVHDMKHDDVMSMSVNSGVMSRLFPEGTIFAHSMNLMLIEDNIPDLLNSINADVFTTTKKGIKRGRHQSTTNNKDDIGQIDFVSASLYNEMGDHFLYEVDLISGNDSLSNTSIDAVKAHIQHHVFRLKELIEDTGNDTGVMTITAGENIPEDLVASCLAQSGLPQSTDDAKATSCVRFFELQNLDSFVKSGDQYDFLTSQWESDWSKNGGESHTAYH